MATNPSSPESTVPDVALAEQHERMLRATAAASQLLLSSRQLTDVVPGALKLLGEAMATDRAYLFQFHADLQSGAPLMSQRYEWCREGIVPQLDNPETQSYPVDPLFTELYKALAAGKVYGGPVHQLPDNVRTYMQAQDVQSLLVVPVSLHGTLWGFAGFDDCRRDRLWSASEEALLFAMAGCLGTALSRHATEGQLQARDSLLRGVALSTQRLLAARTLDIGLQESLATLGQAAQVERAYIFENLTKRGVPDRRLRARFLWNCTSGTQPSPPPGLSDLSYDELFPRWFDILSSGRPISGRVMDFFERSISGQSAGLRSILLVPIMSENRFWGILGFDDGDVTRVWAAGDEAILNAVAGGMGGAIARHHAEQALHHSTDLLRHSQKMEAVGRLAGGVAHDFNNLLTAIMGYGDILLEQMNDDHPMRHELEEICKAADRAHALTRQLLAFSRKQVLEPKVVSLNTVVSDVQKFLGRLIGEDIELLSDLDRDLGTVRMDPGQMEQVVINLAVNARDAMPEGGHLTLSTANLNLTQRLSRGHLVVEPGHYVTITVTDTGHGMPEEVQAHIFEPFFTTKEVGKGTGLGLSMVYGIIEQSGGHIMFQSAPGQGTSFTIYLPRLESATSEKGAGPERTALRGTETILLVEDEEMVRDLAERVLRERGYIVWSARSGAEAIRSMKDHGETIQLLLTDIVMPQMGGQALAHMLKQQKPGLRVLYMSGYAQESYATLDALNLEKNFIQKPFTPPALARKVRDILDAH